MQQLVGGGGLPLLHRREQAGRSVFQLTPNHTVKRRLRPRAWQQYARLTSDHGAVAQCSNIELSDRCVEVLQPDGEGKDAHATRQWAEGWPAIDAEDGVDDLLKIINAAPRERPEQRRHTGFGVDDDRNETTAEFHPKRRQRIHLGIEPTPGPGLAGKEDKADVAFGECAVHPRDDVVASAHFPGVELGVDASFTKSASKSLNRRLVDNSMAAEDLLRLVGHRPVPFVADLNKPNVMHPFARVRTVCRCKLPAFGLAGNHCQRCSRWMTTRRVGKRAIEDERTCAAALVR